MSPSPESLPAAPAEAMTPEKAKEALASLSNAEREKLNADIIDGKGKEAVAAVNGQPERLEEKVKNFTGRELLANLSALRDQNAGVIEGEEGLRTRLLKVPIIDESRMEAILDALVEPLPAYGDELARNDHRYLAYRAVKENAQDEDPLHIYEVRFGATREDQRYLEELKASQPEHAADIEEVRRMIESYMQKDRFRMQLLDYQEGRANNFTDQAIGKMGKMTGLILLAAGAVLTSIMMIANKKFSMAPFLYAGVAGLIASPKLRKSIFGGKHETTLLEVNRALGATFQNLSKKYGIGGNNWASFVEDIQSKAQYVKDFEKKYKGTVPPESEIDAFVAEALGNNATEQEKTSLKALLRNNDLPNLTAEVNRASGKDSKEVVLDYVRLGSHKFAKDMNTLSNTTEEAERNAKNAQREAD